NRPDDLDQAGEPGGGLDDDEQPERPAARQRYMPSSIGASLLVPASAQHITVKASWGDYHRRSETTEEWERTPREETISLDLSKANDQPRELDLKSTKGLKIAYLARPVGILAAEANVPAGARTVSVFVVNRRSPQPDLK